jgi:hypothetical protein
VRLPAKGQRQRLSFCVGGWRDSVHSLNRYATRLFCKHDLQTYTWLVCNPALFANQELRNRYLHQIRKRLRTTYRFTHGQVCVTNTQYLMRPGLTVISGLKRIIWFEERLKGQNTNTTAVQARHGSYRTGVGASGSHIIRIDHSRPFDTTRAVRVRVVFETLDLRANCWY